MIPPKVIERLNAGTQIVQDAAERQRVAAREMIEAMRNSNGAIKAAISPRPKH